MLARLRSALRDATVKEISAQQIGIRANNHERSVRRQTSGTRLTRAGKIVQVFGWGKWLTHIFEILQVNHMEIHGRQP
jgi:hypothetical protein